MGSEWECEDGEPCQVLQETVGGGGGGVGVNRKVHGVRRVVGERGRWATHCCQLRLKVIAPAALAARQLRKQSQKRTGVTDSDGISKRAWAVHDLELPCT